MAAGQAGAGRRPAGDERQGAVTSGDAAGTNGKARRPLLRAYALIVPLFLLAAIINSLSTIYDLHRVGRTLPSWEPISWELSSILAIFVAAPLLPAIARLTPPGCGWVRILALNLLATLPFSLVHTGGMFGLRLLIYRLAGEHYHFVASDFLYEYRKDLLTYLVLYGIFWITGRAAAPQPAAETPRQSPPAELVLTIIDGSRTHRATPGEILALRAAGNYVEFHLAGGERPLMRGSLQEMQEKLAGYGFLRTHRSWVVNPRRVRQLTAQGSGDFLLTLDGGGEAPLSRRFPEALSSLRKKEGAAEATPSSIAK